MIRTGWTMGVTVGRVFREADLGQFSAGSGLDGKSTGRTGWPQVNFTLPMDFA